MKLVLGIDIGTTSISMVLLDQETRQIVAERGLANASRIPGQSPWLQDPEIIGRLVRETYEELRAAWPIEAVGFTCQMHGILYVDAAGRAVSPLYTWQDEHGELPCGSGRTFREELNALTGYSQVRGIATGSITHFYLTRTGQLPAGAVKFCTIGDYLAMGMTGVTEPLAHISNAAGFGLVDGKTGAYDRAAMERAGLDERFFPRIVKGHAVMGRTADGIPVSVALGDNQASFLGSVEDWQGEVLLNLGTGGQISRYSRVPVEGHGLESRPFLGDDYLLVYTSHCGGRAYAALERFFRQVLEMAGSPAPSLYDAMERALAAQPPEPAPPVVEPAFCGTRAEPERRCSITELTLENFTPGKLIRGFLEGICMELMPAFAVFAGDGNVTGLVGAGNTIRRNAAFRRIIEEVFSVPLRLPEQEEEAAVGAARFAGGMEL